MYGTTHSSQVSMNQLRYKPSISSSTARSSFSRIARAHAAAGPLVHPECGALSAAGVETVGLLCAHFGISLSMIPASPGL